MTNKGEDIGLNRLAITVTLSLDETQPDEAYLDFILTVDRAYVHDMDAHWVDPVDLVASANGSGEYYIFTCSCGDPGCVGIDEPVRVEHTADEVRWVVRDPLAWPTGEELPEWTRDIAFIFDRAEYVSTVATALNQAKTLVRYWHGPGDMWTGPEMGPEDLLALEVLSGFGHGVPESNGVVQ